jgi:hypothetical protein
MSFATCHDTHAAPNHDLLGKSRLWRVVAAVQGFYFLVTGIWPSVHIDSFLAVTGPKTDLWLVQLFGALVCVPALVLLYAVWKRNLNGATLIAACSSAVILLVGDVVFVWRGDIGPIYLLDAAIVVEMEV